MAHTHADASRLRGIPGNRGRRNLHQLEVLAAQIASQRMSLVKLEPGNIVLLVTLAPCTQTAPEQQRAW